jgi:predicted amidohydrolase YtcJ
MKRIPLISAALFFLVAASYAAVPAEKADLVLRNGRVVTVDEARPQAEAIALLGDKIQALGSNADMQPYIGPQTRVLDLKGNLAIPGFYDSHAHFLGIGEARMNLNLMNARNWDEIVDMVAQAAAKAKPGEWIRGRGWHQEKWNKKPQPDVEGFPTHELLSRASPNNPVILTHASGHATLANAKAMELAGITAATPNPAGGDVLKDAKGQPIGVFRETASGLLRRAMSQSTSRRTASEAEAEMRRQVELAVEECVSKGVTSLADAGSSFALVELLKKMIDEGKLGMRLWVMLSENNARLKENLPKYKLIGYGDHRLTVRSIKRLMDGALGPRGAWLLEPYSDMPGSSGLNTAPLADVRETARLAIEQGFQLCIHAIGDRANRETLDVYEEAFKAHPEKRDLRWRIEHSQHLNAADIPRFGKLGVIAAMQGIHCTSDAPYVMARLGAERAEQGAYVWQKLMKSGALVSNGTDAPVEDVDPIACFHATVSRKLKNGQVFYPDQRMSRMEALKSYTYNGAYAAFEEDVKGSLVPGKLADIVVLSRDILSVPEDDIRGTEVLFTIVGGKIVFQK